MMKRFILAGVTILMMGCGPDLKPTVLLLKQTIQQARMRDYQTGRVKFSDDKEEQAKMVKSRVGRFLEAERLADIALEGGKK